ncbi:MAG: acyl-ACP--UDP-N-acetylglucosamine O-acyltransferase [Acidobacteriia bacterium]|nr:acyl-ACP--UDP-N-acetylglucosamine O-acyltransferase [Terriglobia bacterium]
MSIHPTAIVDKKAEIGSDVAIGPYCVVAPDVRIGNGTELGPYVSVQSGTTIGESCRFYGHSSIGTDPQDLKYMGEPTRLQIGNRNVFREFVSINRGTPHGGHVTKIGDDGLFMAYSHVGHDGQVGSHVIFANAATLAGHVAVSDHAQVGAFSAIHQFCRVGPHAFIGGFSVVTRDALPYVKTVGARNDAKTYGINTIGLQRKGFAEDSIEELKQVYRILFRSQLNTSDALVKAREGTWTAPEVAVLLEFIESSERGFIR